MTDETEIPEEEEGVEIELGGEAEYVDCERGQVIFPHGTEWYADTHGFNRLYVDYKTGDVTGEDNESGQMRSPSRKRGAVHPIK